MANKSYLAVDMGASSGRHVIGRFDGTKIELEEVYRFENGGVEMADGLFWDLPGQWTHLINGFRAASKAVSKDGTSLTSVGVDTWGVDFALLGKNDTLLANPRHYRDARNNGVMERAIEKVGRDELFKHTGLQFLLFNSLYQLIAMREAESPLLDIAESMLMMPDIFHWLMTGRKGNELTNATTTQFYNPVEKRWATELFDAFDLPKNILGEIIQPGENLGPLRSRLVEATGLTDVRVVAPGTHDTASAVAAVPTSSPFGAAPDWCYVSLGTWALMGIESPHPVVTNDVLARNFTNEGGVGGTTRLLKNICGLWLVQQCRQSWNRAGKNWDWEDLNRLSAEATPLVSFIDPDAPDFLAPTDMPGAIRNYAEKTSQTVPTTEGAVLRAALESLAFKFRQVLAMCEDLAGRSIETIHIVGGGTRNRQLCQMAADCCGRRVVTGPVEATAIGNLMMQAVASGDLADLPEAREVVRNSFEMIEYVPTNTTAWDDAYERFEKVTT